MAKQRPASRPKHVPQRTCIVCRKVDAKRGLIRLVRLPEARVVIDLSGKRAGRGAYLCQEQACWIQAFKRRAIERALHLEQLDPVDRSMLEAHQSTLPVGGADQAQPADGSTQI
ncbi:MAG: hypothetical protein NVS4B8_10100 [Herpetosiphon sp.]